MFMFGGAGVLMRACQCVRGDGVLPVTPTDAETD